MSKIWFWLKNSRLFSLPMTLFSWAIVFTYALKSGGDTFNGVLALIGIAFAHLATNLTDDYIDLKHCDVENFQLCKCAYIREGKATIQDLFRVIVTYLTIAFVVGVILFFRAGYQVALLAIIGGLLTLSYSFLSQRGFSEIAVGIAFGPLLFEGVYFVMCKSFSLEIFWLSLAVVMFTIGLMYTHTVLDYEGDVASHKRTLCSRFSKTNAIKGVWVVYGLGYLFTVIFALISKNYFVLASFILLPLVLNLYNSLKTFTCGGEVKEFYFRLLKARNLMVYYSIIILLCILG